MNFIIPSKDEINALSTLTELKDMREDLERCILNIEAQLEFRDDTSEWEARAIGALSIARYALKNVNRRIYKMQGDAMKPRLTQEEMVAAVKTKQQQKTETIIASTVQNLHLSYSLMAAIRNELDEETAERVITSALAHQSRKAAHILSDQCGAKPINPDAFAFPGTMYAVTDEVSIRLVDFDLLDIDCIDVWDAA